MASSSRFVHPENRGTFLSSVAAWFPGTGPSLAADPGRAILADRTIRARRLGVPGLPHEPDPRGQPLGRMCPSQEGRDPIGTALTGGPQAIRVADARSVRIAECLEGASEERPDCPEPRTGP